MKDKSLLLLVGGVLVVGAAAYWVLHDQATSVPPAEAPTPGQSLGLRVGPNAVVASEQRPGKDVIVSYVGNEINSFIGIHEAKNGAPGAMLGASVLLIAPESQMVKVTLSRATKDGETLYAVLHIDDGDGKFDPKKDVMAKDFQGNDLVAEFTISKDASETPPEVMI